MDHLNREKAVYSFALIIRNTTHTLNVSFLHDHSIYVTIKPIKSSNKSRKLNILHLSQDKHNLKT